MRLDHLIYIAQILRILSFLVKSSIFRFYFEDDLRIEELRNGIQYWGEDQKASLREGFEIVHYNCILITPSSYLTDIAYII